MTKTQLRTRTRSLERALNTVGPSESSTLEWLVPELQTLAEAEGCFAFNLHRTAKAWEADFVHTVGLGTTSARVIREYLARAPEGFSSWRPTSVAEKQRNRVLCWSRMRDTSRSRAARIHGIRILLPRLGVELGPQDALRLMLTHEQRLLAYVAVFRSGCFQPAAVAAVESLLPSLRSRLEFELDLQRMAITSRALDTVLERLNRPAFLLGPDARVAHANQAARAFLESEGAPALSPETVAHTLGAGAEVHRLELPGMRPHVLVMLDSRERPLDHVLKSLSTRWALTPRQTEVFARLVAGDANKDLAARLSCSLGTIELHVTGLLRKAGVSSRALLLSKVLSYLHQAT